MCSPPRGRENCARTLTGAPLHRPSSTASTRPPNRTNGRKRRTAGCPTCPPRRTRRARGARRATSSRPSSLRRRRGGGHRRAVRSARRGQSPLLAAGLLCLIGTGFLYLNKKASAPADRAADRPRKDRKEAGDGRRRGRGAAHRRAIRLCRRPRRARHLPKNAG